MAAIEHAAATRISGNAIISAALRDAFFTALVAFVLFGSLVGFKTEPQQETLILTYRWNWAIILTLGVAVIRFLVDVFVWREIVPLEALRQSAFVAALKPLVGLILPALYFIGTLFFFVEGARDITVGAIISLVSPDWQASIVKLANLVALAITGLFVLVSAMLLAKLARLSWQRIRLGASAETISWQNIRSNLLQELGPALLFIAAFLPFIVEGPNQRYAIGTAIQIMTYIMLGWGLNVVVGLAGLLDLGYVAFYAVGAYSYALLSIHYGLSFWVCLPLAGIFAAMWGIMLGFPVLRLRGDYLAIVTLAFGEIVRLVLINWVSLTGGPNGINRIPRMSFFGIPFDASDSGFSATFGLEYDPVHRVIFFYYVILVLALLTNFVTLQLRRLPIGRAWEALREDEIACRSLGINTVITKLSAFATGAFFAGLAGSFFATQQGFISPESFTFNESALVLAIVVLGGMGSQLGVVIAAVVLIGSSEFFRDLDEYRMLIFGASMVALMTWRPRGLVASRTPTIALKERKEIAASLVQEGRG